MTEQKRHPGGSPAGKGGEWASENRARTDVDLAGVAPDPHKELILGLVEAVRADHPDARYLSLYEVSPGAFDVRMVNPFDSDATPLSNNIGKATDRRTIDRNVAALPGSRLRPFIQGGFLDLDALGDSVRSPEEAANAANSTLTDAATTLLDAQKRAHRAAARALVANVRADLPGARFVSVEKGDDCYRLVAGPVYGGGIGVLLDHDYRSNAPHADDADDAIRWLPQATVARHVSGHLLDLETLQREVE